MPERVRITALVENRAASPLVAEHGLALWIEADDRRILFDTGAGKALPHNAAALGIDVAKADAVVLSHGHYDHTGGLPHVMELAPGATYYAHPAALEEKFRIADGTPPKRIGMPHQCVERLSSGRPRFVPTAGPTQIAPGIAVTGEVLRTTEFEPPEPRFFLDAAGRRPDLMRDDQALVIECAGRLIVLCGCAHAGLVNTIRTVRLQNAPARIRAIIGGFHLRSAPEERLARTAQAIRQLRIPLVAPCHCTDEAAQAHFKKALAHRFRRCTAGTAFEFD